MIDRNMVTLQKDSEKFRKKTGEFGNQNLALTIEPIYDQVSFSI